MTAVFNFILKLIFHSLPVPILDNLVNSSLPKTERGLKIFSRIDPSLFDLVSRRKVLCLFRNARNRIPAYSKFLRQHNISPEQVRSLNDLNNCVPQTTKKNYVQLFPLAETCYNASLPKIGFLEESAGTSGKSTYWVKSLEEENESLSMTIASMNYLFGFKKNERIIILNCYMMGGWTGGLRFASRMGNLGVVRNIGPDPGKVIQCLTELGKDYTYLLGAYPPFIIDLLNFQNKPIHFDWKNYRINIFCGGEGFVEEWREYVASRLHKGALIFSDYGAIDMDVGLSSETPFSVVVRRLINNDGQLRHKLFQSDRLPVYVGQYSPTKYYIRNTINPDGQKEPEVTVLNLKSVSPKIKYIIGDEGGVVGFRDLVQILEQSGYSIPTLKKEYKLPIVIPFPILYIYGRSDGTVTINGALISPSEINRAILSDPELVSAIHTFKLSVATDHDNRIKLYVLLEIRADTTVSPAFKEKCSNTILNTLLQSNECFRVEYEKNPETHKPVYEFIQFQTGIFNPNKSSLKNSYLI